MNKQMQTFDQGRALFDLSQRRILLQSDHPSLPMDPQRNFKNINFTLQKDEFHRGNSCLNINLNFIPFLLLYPIKVKPLFYGSAKATFEVRGIYQHIY